MADELQFGTIKFEGMVCSLQDQDTAKFVKVRSDCCVETLIDGIKDKWGLSHPNLLLSVMGGAWDFPVSNSVYEVFNRGMIKATVGTEAWVVTSGTHVGAAKYCAEAVYESMVVNEGMGRNNTVVTIGIASWEWLLEVDKDKIQAAVNSSAPASIQFPTSDMQRTDKMLNPHHSHFILVENVQTGVDSMDFTFTQTTLKVRSKLEKQMSTYKTEATDADFADILHEIRHADLPRFFHGLGIESDSMDIKTTSANETSFAALDRMKKWKEDRQMSATRHSLMRALKRCNTEATKNMQHKWRDGQVPVVCIYIEGGAGVLHHACLSVNNGLPIVIVDDSGRASSLLALAYKSDGLKRDHNQLKMKIGKIMKDQDDGMFNTITCSLNERRHLWNVYEQTSEIDQVILEAVMKAYSENIGRQLDLAQTWNRFDIITKEFFINMIENMQWDDFNAEAKYFEERLHVALVNNQPGFVKLFLDNGVINLNTYLTRSELESLYSEVDDSPIDVILPRMMLKNKNLESIGRVLHYLSLGQLNPYRVDRGHDEQVNDVSEKLGQPYEHLFLFAILNKFHEMAEYFWDEGREHMAAALAGVILYRSMGDRLVGDNNDLFEFARKYESLSCDILSSCSSDFDTDVVNCLLLRTLPNWDNTTCLQLAESCDSHLFLAHDDVQLLVQNIWTQGLPQSAGAVQSSSNNFKRGEKVAPKGNGNIPTNTQSDDEVEVKQPSMNSTSRRFLRALVAPRAKFVYNVMSFVLLIALFSYIMLTNHSSEPSPSAWEWVLIVWFATLIVEEIRQIIHGMSHSKLREYITDYWNVIDLMILILFVVAIFLRLFPNTREEGRVILATVLFICYFRLLEALKIFRTLGPKVIMIFKMLRDLAFFMVILFVIIVGYGIAAYSVQYPNAWQYGWDLQSFLYNIFFIAYFQVYGELFLENIQATESDGSCTNNVTAIMLGAQECPRHSFIGILFLAFYLLVSNLLLLNLIIAIFSDTFTKVQEETDVLWKSQFYSVTKEYFQRPVLTAPFIIIVHVYRSVRWLLKRTGVLNWRPAKMGLDFSKAKTEKLIKLEDYAGFSYVTNKRRRRRNAFNSSCSCIHQTETSKKRILDRLNEFNDMGSVHSMNQMNN